MLIDLIRCCGPGTFLTAKCRRWVDDRLKRASRILIEWFARTMGKRGVKCERIELEGFFPIPMVVL